MNDTIGSRISWSLYFAILFMFYHSVQSFSQSLDQEMKGSYPHAQQEELKNNFDGDRFSARLSRPSGIAVSTDGIIYVADSRHNTIRRIDVSGNVQTFAGNPTLAGSKDGHGLSATFFNPSGIALSEDGSLYVVNRATNNSATIRKIDASGNVSTLSLLEGNRSYTLRPHFPNGIAVAKDGTVFLTESTRITLLTPDGRYMILAGHLSESGYCDGRGAEARFDNVVSIVIGKDGALYVSDKNNNVIRRIDRNGTVSTYAGIPGKRGHRDGPIDEAMFALPVGITVDKQGNLYVADLGNDVVRKIATTGQVSTIAGVPGGKGFLDGPASKAMFNRPVNLTVTKEGTIYVSDLYNDAIRIISKEGVVTTLVGVSSSSEPDSAQIN